MLVALLTALVMPSGTLNRLEAVVTPVTVLNTQQIAELPVRDLTQILTVRPGSTAQPLERSSRLILLDRPRTGGDIDSLLSIDKIEVLRGPQGTLFGQSALDSVGSILFRGLDQARDTWEGQHLTTTTFNPLQGIQDGGFTQWTLRSRYHDLFGNAEIFSVTTSAAQPPVRTLLGSKQIYLGTYVVPDAPQSQFFSDTMPNPSLLDTVGGMTFAPKYAERLGISQICLPTAPGVPGAALTTSPMDYFAHTSSLYGADRVAGWIRGSALQMGDVTRMLTGAAAQGEDMNSLSFPGDLDAFANTDCGSDVRFPGGTMWLPDRPGYQTMMNSSPLRYTFNAFHASIDGGEVQGKMRTYCLNMALKEPEKGVRYYPFAPSSPVLAALAKIENRSPIRGLYDQARTWIFTDKAGLAEINKRLFPKITPGRYVSTLSDVVRVGGFAQKDLLRPEVFDPTLLLGVDADRDAFAWFSAHVARSFPKELAAFIGSSADLRKLLASTVAAERTHGIRLVRSVLSAPSSEPRLALLEVLRGLEGADHLKGQVGDLRSSFYSEHPKEVEAALEVSERLQTARPADALRYLGSTGAAEAIKAKAKALLGSSARGTK